MAIIGKQIEAGLSIEGTRGASPASTSKWVKNVDFNVVAMAEKVVDDNSFGRIEGSEGQRTAQKWYEGDISGILHADAIGYFFNNIYGAVSTTTVESGEVFSHEFTVNNDIENETLSIYAKNGDVNQKVYSGAMVDTLEVSASVDDYARFTASMIAQTESSNSNTPSYDTEYDFIGRDITIKVADTEAGLSSANAQKAKNVSITFNNGGIRDHTFGSRNPDNVYNSDHMVEGDFELNYEDDTFRDLWQGEDYKYMQVQIQGEADIGSGNNPSITLLLNRTGITDWDRSGGNDELVTQSVSFRGFYNQSDSQLSKVTLQNKTQQYDTPYA